MIKVIREGRFEGNFLSSCDAIALYPSIVVEEGLQLLEDKIIEDNSLKTTDSTKPEIIKLARLCSEEEYFEYGRTSEQLISRPGDRE